MENVCTAADFAAERITSQLKEFHQRLRHVPEPEARIYYENLRACLTNPCFDGLHLENGRIRQDTTQKVGEKTATETTKAAEATKNTAAEAGKTDEAAKKAFAAESIPFFSSFHGEEAERVYNRVQILRAYDFAQFWRLYSRRLIVSVTSYPARIMYVGAALKSILAQTLPADEVVLYLAAEQFPQGEEGLPEDLLQMIASGEVTLKWCADLKPHKKYFYAFRDYPEDLVVTIDDDLLYAAELLEQLLDTHLRFPHAVAASRVHLMLFAADGSVLPYFVWVQETDASRFVPSMQLFATGGAGTLYPPHLFPEDMLDEDAIRETCLLADDLWMKAMEAMADVPVVLCCRFRPLQYVPGSQKETLWKENIDGGCNDRQFAQIMAWADAHYGPGILQEKLGSKDVGVNLQGVAEVRRHIRVKQERTIDLSKYLYARLDLKNAGDAVNDLELLSLSDDQTTVQMPAWFQENGRGYVFRAKSGFLEFTVRCKGDGELSFALRGPDAGEIAGRRMPVWIEYRAFLVDAQTVFSARKNVWHDHPYRYSMPVTDGQLISVQLEWTADFVVIGSGHSVIEEEIKAYRHAEQEQRKRNEEQKKQIRELKQKLEGQKAKNAELKQKKAAANEKIDRLRQQRNAANAKNDRMKASLSWKIGRAITWLPRKIRNMLKRAQ